MAGIETKFGIVPDHRGPYARKTYEIDRLNPEGAKPKTRKVIIIDTNTPVSKIQSEKK